MYLIFHPLLSTLGAPPKFGTFLIVKRCMVEMNSIVVKVSESTLHLSESATVRWEYASLYNEVLLFYQNVNNS